MKIGLGHLLLFLENLALENDSYSRGKILQILTDEVQIEVEDEFAEHLMKRYMKKELRG